MSVKIQKCINNKLYIYIYIPVLLFIFLLIYACHCWWAVIRTPNMKYWLQNILFPVHSLCRGLLGQQKSDLMSSVFTVVIFIEMPTFCTFFCSNSISTSPWATQILFLILILVLFYDLFSLLSSENRGNNHSKTVLKTKHLCIIIYIWCG